MTPQRTFGRAGGLALLVGSLAIAGVTAGSSAAATRTHAAGKPSSILFVNPLPKYPQWRLIGDCIAKAAKAAGVKETETGPTGTLNPTAMIAQVQQGISNKVGAIITFPASAGFGPVLQQAQKAGITTGTLYGSSTGANTGADVNTGVDWTALGKQYVAAIAARKGPQHVGLLAQAPDGPGKDWVDGFKAAAKATRNVTVTAVVYTGDDATKALDQSNALLTAHPDINVLASHMGTATPGASSAIKAKHDVGKVVMVANGGSGGGITGAKDGTVYRFLLQDLCTEGKDAVNAVIAKAEGKKTPTQISVDTVMAGLGTYKKYIAKGWA
jgi:ABC-type sugar transport system substrate-binding protein